jgi:hypothetical protein
MRWLVGSVLVAALGGGAWWLVRAKGDDTTTITASAPRDPAIANVTPTPSTPPPPGNAVSDKQEQDERTLIEEFSVEQKLPSGESAKLLASLKAMQDGRRQLFADLKDRKLSMEELSTSLRDLRATMNRSFERDLGRPRSDQLIDRIRIANGGEAKSDK